MNLNLHKETYNINGESCQCVANFADNTLHIMARGFNETFNLDEYTNFPGNMSDFATTKLRSTAA